MPSSVPFLLKSMFILLCACVSSILYLFAYISYLAPLLRGLLCAVRIVYVFMCVHTPGDLNKRGTEIAQSTKISKQLNTVITLYPVFGEIVECWSAIIWPLRNEGETEADIWHRHTDHHSWARLTADEPGPVLRHPVVEPWCSHICFTLFIWHFLIVYIILWYIYSIPKEIQLRLLSCKIADFWALKLISVLERLCILNPTHFYLNTFKYI